MIDQRIPRFYRVLWTAAVCACFAFTAQAQTASSLKIWSWNVESGYPQSWNWDQNWSPHGVPSDNNVALVDGHCDYNSWSLPYPHLAGLVVTGHSSGAELIWRDGQAVDSDGNLVPVRYVMHANAVTVGKYIGYGTRGYLEQTGGDLRTEHIKIDSQTTSWTAKYKFGGTADVRGMGTSGPETLTLDIGGKGRGTFEQIGGTLNARNITLGQTGGSHGKYVQSAGQTTTEYLDVAGYGNGSVSIYGGTLNALTRTQIGVNAEGTLKVYGNGTFGGAGAGDVSIGVNAPGTFYQNDNASVDVHNILVGYGAQGEYRMTNGRTEAVNLGVAHYAPGEMTMDDGELIVHGALDVGYRPEDAGRFEWNGGMISADIAVQENSTFVLGHDFTLNLFNSNITNPHFAGSLYVAQGAFEISNGATAQMNPTSPVAHPFEAGILRIGSDTTTGRLNLAQGSVYVRDALEMSATDFAGMETSTLRTMIAGTVPGDDYGQVLPIAGATPSAQLNGELNVSFIQNFAPQTGNTFDVMTGFAAINGQFERIVIEGLAGDFDYDLSYANGGVRMTALSDGIPGDARIEEVQVGSDGFASLGGGSVRKGGLDLFFPDTIGGRLKGKLGHVSKDSLQGILPQIPDRILGGKLQIIQYWDIDYAGSFNGKADLTFTYDHTLLGGLDEMSLGIYHFNRTFNRWDLLDTLWQDTWSHAIAVQTDSFSPFALAYVPEPASLTLLILAGALLRRRPKLSQNGIL